MEHHLFLLPKGRLADELGTTIQSLAGEHDGPAFQPHVTLLGPIPELEEADVVAKAKEIAKMLNTLELTLGKPAIGDSFFHSVYIEVHVSEELVHAHMLALQAFGMSDDSEYKPHLSLMYGDFPIETKEKVLKSLTLPHQNSFTADTIYVFKTDGPATSWEQVAEVALQ
jgi:2'-5' RNA ligase